MRGQFTHHRHINFVGLQIGTLYVLGTLYVHMQLRISTSEQTSTSKETSSAHSMCRSAWLEQWWLLRCLKESSSPWQLESRSPSSTQCRALAKQPPTTQSSSSLLGSEPTYRSETMPVWLLLLSTQHTPSLSNFVLRILAGKPRSVLHETLLLWHVSTRFKKVMIPQNNDCLSTQELWNQDGDDLPSRTHRGAKCFLVTPQWCCLISEVGDTYCMSMYISRAQLLFS